MDAWAARSSGRRCREDRGPYPRTPVSWGPNSPKPPEWDFAGMIERLKSDLSGRGEFTFSRNRNPLRSVEIQGILLISWNV
jgi:hypothetical protein